MLNIDNLISSGIRDPFELAEELGIIILRENLGTIYGYYNSCFGVQFIHINQKLNDTDKLFTCAHELAHAVLHPDVNTPFLQAHTFFSVEKMEREAHAWAMRLLISDEVVEEDKVYTVDQLSAKWGYPAELVELRLKK